LSTRISQRSLFPYSPGPSVMQVAFCVAKHGPPGKTSKKPDAKHPPVGDAVGVVVGTAVGANVGDAVGAVGAGVG